MTATTMEMIIGDQSTAGASNQWLDVINPATEQVQAQVPHADEQDVDQAVQTARRAFEDGPWSRMSPSERGRLLYRLAELVDQHSDELALLDTQDMGKPYEHARNHDLPMTVSALIYYAGLADKIRGTQIPAEPDKHVYTICEPVGVVAGIMPWNFPLVLTAWKLGPALACGNVIILKPAEQSPRSAVLLAQLALEAGIPPGVVNTVTGLGETTGAALVRHPGVDKVSFTGSTEVGREIMRACADKIAKVTLELGGKTANIVMDDADMEAALASTLMTSFYNSGQICTTGSRLVVNRRVHDQFIDAMQDKVNSLKVGDPMQPDTKLGPLVSREQYDKVKGYIALAEAEYNPIICGTRSQDLDCGYYVNPTIVDHVDPDSRIAQEEIFGPVLSVIDFDDEEQACRIANQTSYGLAAAIWTQDVGRAHRMAAKLNSGLIWVNCNNYINPSMPVEGFGQSGNGVDLGSESVQTYTRVKTVTVNLDRTPHPWAGE